MMATVICSGLTTTVRNTSTPTATALLLMKLQRYHLRPITINPSHTMLTIVSCDIFFLHITLSLVVTSRGNTCDERRKACMIQKLIVRIKAYREYKHLDYWFRQEGTKHTMSKKQFIRNRLKKAGF